MKNLYSYKNAIASGLKRYSKFLLLAISFFMLGSSAWAVAPAGDLYMKCNTTTNDDNFADSDFYWVTMKRVVGEDKWVSEEFTLENINNNFFVGTSENDNDLFTIHDINFIVKDFSPVCATNFSNNGGYSEKRKFYLGKAQNNPSCDITIVLTYIDDHTYIIQADSKCNGEPTAPEVTTGSYYLDNGNLVVTDNVLNELYKDCSYNRYLTGMGVEIVTSGGDFVSKHPFTKDNNREWVDYRGKTFTVNTGVTATEYTCYRAYAYYNNGETEYKGYGDIVCVEPIDDPTELTFALATTNTDDYAGSIKLTKESENVYSTTIKLNSNNPTYFIVDSENNIWARNSSKTIVPYTNGTANNEYATMTNGRKTNGTILTANSGKTIKVTFTKTSASAGSLTFTMDETAKTPAIRIGKQPVVNGYSVDMNFQLADWGCTPVSKIKIYYTTDGTEPTTSSAFWEYEINPTITSNVNFTRSKADLPLGEYKIKVSAMNEIGWSDLSDMATFVIECIDPEPSIPIISFGEKTICSGSSTYIEIGNVDAGLRYSLYKDGELMEDKILTDGKFTGISEAGIYTVKAMNNCDIESTSPAIELLVIDANSITITPTTATTNPWVPVNFTVKSTSGNPYKLVYKDDKSADVTAEMVVVKNGDDYSLKIPRPSTWEKVNASQGNTTYTVNVIQEAGETQCSSKTLTITLDDTFDDCD